MNQAARFAAELLEASASAYAGYAAGVLLERHPEMPHAAAQWELRLTGQGVDQLTIRSGDASLRHPMLIGGFPAPPVQRHDGWTTRVVLRRYRPGGLIAGLPGWGLPGWLLAYLGITIATFVLLKRTFTW